MRSSLERAVFAGVDVGQLKSTSLRKLSQPYLLQIAENLGFIVVFSELHILPAFISARKI
jgi:hypothetical protein